MNFDNKLLDLDYLVYSSHKTGTQSLTRTLIHNGFKCKHCHFIQNIGLNDGDLQNYLKAVLKKKGLKLNVISVFREPIEQHISSFFQYYGTRSLNLGEVEHETQTIIYKYTIEQLQEQFISDLNGQALFSFDDSILHICEQLQINFDDLSFNKDNQFGLYESNIINLYLFRFDLLFGNYVSLLNKITGKNISPENNNMSVSKWYKDIYLEFKSSITIPCELISKIYCVKRNLIELFYSDSFEMILNRAFIKYGEDTG
jgi:hypothetical protein